MLKIHIYFICFFVYSKAAVTEEAFDFTGLWTDLAQDEGELITDTIDLDTSSEAAIIEETLNDIDSTSSDSLLDEEGSTPETAELNTRSKAAVTEKTTAEASVIKTAEDGNTFLTKDMSRCKVLNCNSCTGSEVRDDIGDLVHSTVRRNSAGNIKYFETHFVLKTDGWLYIYLTPDVISQWHQVPNHSHVISLIVVNGEFRQVSLFNNKPSYDEADIRVPYNRSSLNFTAFYLTVSAEGIQFGEEGDYPLINYMGPTYSVKYLSFGSPYRGKATILYDCPAPSVEKYGTKGTSKLRTSKLPSTKLAVPYKSLRAKGTSKQSSSQLSSSKFPYKSLRTQGIAKLGTLKSWHSKLPHKGLRTKETSKLRTSILSTTKLAPQKESKVTVYEFLQNTSAVSALNDTTLCKVQQCNNCSGSKIHYDIDQDLTHASLTRNSTGYLTYFKTNFAIKTDQSMHIFLAAANKDCNSGSCSLIIKIGAKNGNFQKITVHQSPNYFITTFRRPRGRSDINFTAFYLKVSEDRLQFGQEGKSPFIDYKGLNFSPKLFSFGSDSRHGGKATILYDCPTTD